jgi:hypothetical protein
MKEQNDDKLKKLIRQSGLESPSQDFTDFVMNSVQSELQHDFVASNEFKAMLQSNAIEKPSADFLLRVMSHVEVQQMVIVPITEAKPIISNRVWYWLAGVAACLSILVVFFYRTTGKSADTTPTLTFSDKLFSNISSGITSIPATYSLSMIAVCGLLILDHFLRSRSVKHLIE